MAGPHYRIECEPMDHFIQDIRDWQPFFSAVATASATLVGLLFVSLSLRRDSDRGNSGIKRLGTAQGSFGDFLYVLMIGLVFLILRRAPVGLGVALIVLGAARGAGLIRQSVRSSAVPAGKMNVSDALRKYAIPGLASLGLILLSIEIFRGETIAIYGLVFVIAALLTTGSWNAWLLLIEA